MAPGLELACIELARTGLPKDELDGLRTEHVSFQAVKIAYLLDFDSNAGITSFKKLMVHDLKNPETMQKSCEKFTPFVQFSTAVKTVSRHGARLLVPKKDHRNSHNYHG